MPRESDFFLSIRKVKEAEKATVLQRIEQCRRKNEKSLDLAGLGLESLPPEIGQLPALTSLYLRGNQLASLPPDFAKLSALTSLDLSENKLASLPPDFAKLSALTSLNLSGNKLASLPPDFAKLSALTSLYLRGNQLASLPPDLAKLSALTSLDLSENKLASLPPDFAKLSALTSLNLSGNQLASLPPDFAKLSALTELYLHSNPGLGLPDSVLGPSFEEKILRDLQPARPSDILNFYFSRLRGAASGTLSSVNEIKVMLVGRGGAGKTSLRRFFMGEPHNKGEKETPGIALDSFTIHCARGEIVVRLWDFAGQEITHALHQFFLTEGCIYILVLDPRSNTEMRDAEYWLGLLKRYAGGAPVLVALNRQDARQGGYDVDQRILLERFPFIQSFTPTNCEKREGCRALLDELCAAVDSLKDAEPPHLKVPESWLHVMQDCGRNPEERSATGIGWIHRILQIASGSSPSEKRREHMTLEEFRGICVKRGETDPGKQESLARLLHKLGAVLHFVDEPRLRDTTVLNPHWVTDGVYRLLRFKDRVGTDGTLTMAEALQALPGETETTARFLLRLMERFEMCFPLDDEDSSKPASIWLVPGALGEFQPEGVTTDWQNPGSVRLRYVYDPLPEGVLPRFIVMTRLLSEGKPRWRNGVVVEDGPAAALVRRGEKRNHVEVVAFGPETDRLRLLEIIQGTFDRINADLPDPKPIAEIELAGLPGTFRPMADLEAAELGGQQVAVDSTLGKVLVQPTPQLNQASEPMARREDREPPLQLFLSYSHDDKKAKAIFQQNLTVMTKKKFIQPWHDGLIEPGMRWREEIEENLARMDIFVGLLTTAFLASDFIDQVELKAAREKLRQQGRDFLFVLILVDDISLAGLDLAEYQILKPNDMAVSSHTSRKAGFNQAQIELERVIARRQELKKGLRRDDRSPAIRATKAQEAEGITIIVQGDYIKGDKAMTNDNRITVGGNVVNSQVGQTLTNCSNMIQMQAPGERKTLLVELETLTKQLMAALPPEKKEEAAGNLELAVKGVVSNPPNRKWYSLSAEGLLDASKFVKNFSGNIAGTLGNLGKLLWPDFKLPGK